MGFVAPAILSAFGVAMACACWRLDRRNQHLSERQYVWGFGVFSWGTGMVLFSAILDYLFSKPISYRFSHPTVRHVVIELVVYLAAGWLVGVFTAPKHSDAELPVR
jgi:hypothetical protein